MTLREAAQRVLAGDRQYTGAATITFFCVPVTCLDDLRAALAEHDEREKLRDAVIEAARPMAKRFHARGWDWTETEILTNAVDAFDAVERPRYEARDLGMSWVVGPQNTKECSAIFYGPDAERHARDLAARLNGGAAE